MLTTNATSNIPPGCEQLNDGDTSFMIMATTFVMLQTPALGLAQAGIIRRKNALSMLMQTLTGFVIGSLLWFICGFSLSFGPSFHGFIGNLQHPSFFRKCTCKYLFCKFYSKNNTWYFVCCLSNDVCCYGTSNSNWGMGGKNVI